MGADGREVLLMLQDLIDRIFRNPITDVRREVVGLRELSQLLDVCYKTLLRAVQAGRLEAVPVGRQWKVGRDALEQYSYAYASGGQEGFIWLPEAAYGLSAGMNSIGGLPGYEKLSIFDINNSGQIVGHARTDGGTGPRAVLWENGVFYDLNDLIPADSGYELHIASAINDEGQIAAIAEIMGGTYRAVLLTPVPEPATLSLLALGGLAVIRKRRRRG